MRHTQGRQYTPLATNGLAGASLSTANVKANTVDFTPVLQVCGRKTLTVHLHCLLFLLWVMKQKMINNLKRNNKNKTHSLLSKGWKSRKVGSSMMATNPLGPLIPAMNWLYMHLKDICSRHPSSSYLRLGKHFLPLAHLLPGCCIMHWVPHWVELLQEKMPQEMRSASMVLPKRIPVWLLLPVSHIQLLSLCCSLLHKFLFTFLSVYCTLNSHVATIHRRTMGTGRQWMTGM